MVLDGIIDQGANNCGGGESDWTRGTTWREREGEREGDRGERGGRERVREKGGEIDNVLLTNDPHQHTLLSLY